MSDKTSTEEILKRMRSGYSLQQSIEYGEHSFEVRLLKNDEEVQVIEQARNEGTSQGLTEDKIILKVMKSVLYAAGTLKGSVNSNFPFSLTDQLKTSELEALYNRYNELLNEVDKEFMDMDMDLVDQIIKDVQQGKLKPRQASTGALSMIGVFFLERMLPLLKEHGS